MKLDGLVVNEETLIKEYLKLYNIADFKHKYWMGYTLVDTKDKEIVLY